MVREQADPRGTASRGTKRKVLGAMLLAPAFGILAACMGPMQIAGTSPMGPQVLASAMMRGPTSIVPQAPQATPGLGQRERFQLAVNQLQQGDAAHAEAELKQYLAEVPNSVPAKNLLAQIETPIEMLYPAENFTIQLGRDETLSSVAGMYLGDVLSFYGLARYNNIENPSRLSVGQTIRIPSTPQALAAQAMRGAPMQQASVMPPAGGPAQPRPPVAPARPAAPADPWVGIRQDVAAGRFDAAIKAAEAVRGNPNAAQATVLAAAYAGNAKAIRTSNAMLAETQAIRAGQLYLETANRPQDALEPLQLALAINAANMRAQTLLASAKARSADIEYRNGVAAFQKQDLDGAIAAFDRALAIAPDHKNAQLNRAQALELKQNLQKLR